MILFLNDSIIKELTVEDVSIFALKIDPTSHKIKALRPAPTFLRDTKIFTPRFNYLIDDF